MTDKELYEAAQEIKKFCETHVCIDGNCPFFKVGCALEPFTPAEWEV